MTEIRRKNNKITVLLAAIILSVFFAACDSGRVFEEYVSLKGAKWHKDSLVSFSVTVTDTTAAHNLYLNLRHKGNYAYSNIWVFIDVGTPGGESITDTIEYLLADPSGRWRGSGLGDIYDTQLVLRNNVLLPDSGKYIFTLQHGMRVEWLEGITDVGIRVEKIK